MAVHALARDAHPFGEPDAHPSTPPPLSPLRRLVMEDVGRPLLEPRLEHLIMIKIAGLDEIADFGTGLPAEGSAHRSGAEGRR